MKFQGKANLSPTAFSFGYGLGLAMDAAGADLQKALKTARANLEIWNNYTAMSSKMGMYQSKKQDEYKKEIARLEAQLKTAGDADPKAKSKQQADLVSSRMQQAMGTGNTEQLQKMLGSKDASLDMKSVPIDMLKMLWETQKRVYGASSPQANEVMQELAKRMRTAKDAAGSTDKNGAPLAEGDKVTHPTYGKGLVVGEMGSGRVDVDFLSKGTVAGFPAKELIKT